GTATQQRMRSDARRLVGHVRGAHATCNRQTKILAVKILAMNRILPLSGPTLKAATPPGPTFIRRLKFHVPSVAFPSVHPRVRVWNRSAASGAAGSCPAAGRAAAGRCVEAA